MRPNQRTILVISAVIACLASFVAWQRWRVAETSDASMARDGSEQGREPGASHGATRRDPSQLELGDTADRPVDPRVPPAVDAIATQLRAPRLLAGTVTEASGTPPEREGAGCRLGIDRTDDPARCRVVLECGETRLHGEPIIHDVGCAFAADGSLSALVDEGRSRDDRDPSLVFDASARTLTVADDRGGFYGEYALVIGLTDPTPTVGDSP
jgi:hypothetical protein